MNFDVSEAIAEEVFACMEAARRFVDSDAVLLLFKEYLEVQIGHNWAAEADAGFDGGEFSGPAHGRAIDREIRGIVAAHNILPVDDALDLLEQIDARVDEEVLSQDLWQGPDARGFDQSAVPVGMG